jgi:hypothetical protein
MFHAAANIRIDNFFGQRRQLELSTGEINRVSQIVAGIGQRPIEVEHHKLDTLFHQR